MSRKLAHDHEAGAVGEREVLVPIVEEQVARLVESFAVHALPAEPRALVDLAPPQIGRLEPQPEAEQREGLVDDEISGNQRLAGFERRVASRAGPGVGWIGAVGTGHPAGGIHEYAFHGLYSCRS